MVLLISFLVFALLVFLGYIRGFAKIILKLAAFLLAILLANLLAPMVGDFIVDNTEVDDYIKQQVSTRLEAEAERTIRAQLDEQFKGYGVEVTTEMVKEVADQAKDNLSRSDEIELLTQLNIPEFAKTALIENNNDMMKKQMGVDNFYDYVASYVARVCVNAIAYGITWLMVGLVLALIFFIISLTVKLPVISTVDKFGGMVLGAIAAVVVLWAFYAIAEVLSGAPLADSINKEIADSSILSTFNSVNIFTSILGKMTSI